VPAILYPLIDTTAHIVQPKWIGFETANLDRLVGCCDVGAILAIGQAGLQLVAPPILRLGSSSRGIFPFGFARKPVGPSRGVRAPRDILLGIAPTYIRDGRIVFPGCREATCFCGSAIIPFPHSDTNLLIENGLIVT
jgi:hypothetical protein